MATIALYAGKINNMPGLIKDVKSTVTEFKSELSNLKKKSLQVNKGICNIDDVISTISTSTQIQEQKASALESFQKNCEQFIADTARIDSDVADIVNQNKDDFYNKYNYLKPDCEKSGWEKFCAGCKKVGEWCKENWELIYNITLAIIAVVAIVAVCVVTFGAAAVFLTAFVGAVVGVVGQLISDVISWMVTGEWTGTWQSYVGAMLGGIAGGVLVLTGNCVAACAVDAAISTLFSESLEGITGGEKRSMDEIWLDTVLSAGTAAACSKLFDIVSGKLCKSLSKTPVLRRLSGRGSYAASFKMVVTKLKDGTIKNFTVKTIRNGIIGGLAGDIIKNIVYGLGFDDFTSNGVKGIVYDIFTKENIASIINSVAIPKIVIIPQIYILPIRSY